MITQHGELSPVWERVLRDIEQTVSKGNFVTWFTGVAPLRFEDGTFLLAVPNEFVKEWLSAKYHKEILRALRTEMPEIRTLDYIISAVPAGGAVKVQPKTPEHHKELPLAFQAPRKDNLNPKYTFDTFVVGTFNELAYSAAQAILKKPGMYNPFFVYGSTGTGKTHLIQALGHGLQQNFPHMHVFYVSSEKFQMDYVNSLQSNRINSFKEKYRSYDVLIIDDIQLLSGREKMQEELFHLFNILYEKNKQIIFSSDKHPNSIPGLEDRLRSRFGMGMTIDIVKPEYESRMAILRNKTKELGREIPFEILDFIASHVEGNIRELEGILNSLIVHLETKGKYPELTEVKSLIKNNIKPKKHVSLEEIIKTIARFYDIEENLIYEKTRRQEIVHCRQMVMYLLREDFNISFPLIGKKLGGRDHTTVMHSYEKIKTDAEDNTDLVREIEQIRAMLSM